MPTYTVVLRIIGPDGESVLTRAASWELDQREGEGVSSITSQPEAVSIPPELQTPSSGPSPSPSM